MPLDQRIAAATATARSGTNACAPIRPFYWEVGDRMAALASGSVEVNAGGAPTYTASTVMNIASASKWLYAAYVAQRRGSAALTADDVKFLSFRSGYTNFSRCLSGQTVDECLAYAGNGNYVPANDGLFFYDGGHMQKHASLIGLGAMGNAALAAEIRSQIGSDVAMSYSQPQLAGGVVSSAADYARFLRKLLDGSLRLGTQLGRDAVCASPTACPGVAVSTPIPSSERWQYSIGHWVESDPAVGDGAFSSAGAFGFYPWIDSGRSVYGIVARESLSVLTQQPGYESVQCGRLIRQAWLTGVAR
jgi:CubicO group peptidase (beta-lactamase class C family)